MADGKNEDGEGVWGPGDGDQAAARFFDGAASRSDEETLAALTAQSAGARREAARQLVVDRVLRGMARPPLDPGPVMQAIAGNEPQFVDRVMRSLPPAPARPKRLAAWTTGVVAVAAAVVLWLGREKAPQLPRSTATAARSEEPPRPVTAPEVTPRSFARLQNTTGSVRALGPDARTLTGPAVLTPGTSLVTTGAASAATMIRDDGARLSLGGDAVVTVLEKDVVFLTRGLLDATVPGLVVIATPHVRVETTLSGARLRVDANAAVTRVDVQAGIARLSGTAGNKNVEVAKGQYALVKDGQPTVAAQAKGGRALFVVGNDPVPPGDRALVGRLTQLGYEVRTILPGDVALEPVALASKIVLVSSTVESVDLTARLRVAPVPIVTWERSLFDDLGMTAPCEEGACGEAKTWRVLIKDPTHQLAAGLSGLITPATAGPFTWGTPGLHAAWVATSSGHPDRAVVFAYERGTQMPGLIAPARRVALFMGDWSPARMLEPGWRLFDAAVEWASADPP